MVCNVDALRPLRARLRRFLRAREGVAALEFALILPVMLTLYIGVVEISDAYPLSGKVEATASSLSDLAAQTSTIGSAEMTNIFDAASAIIAPYPDATLGLRLSGVRVNASGVARIAWSRGRGTLEARGSNSTVTLPTALNAPSSFLVMAEVTYDYMPIVCRALRGIQIETWPGPYDSTNFKPIVCRLLPIDTQFGSTFYTRPRVSTEITLE